jgi:hypothetical protein
MERLLAEMKTNQRKIKPTENRWDPKWGQTQGNKAKADSNQEEIKAGKDEMKEEMKIGQAEMETEESAT